MFLNIKCASAIFSWTEAKKDFEMNRLSKVKPPGQGITLKRSQIKKIKKAAFLVNIDYFVDRFIDIATSLIERTISIPF